MPVLAPTGEILSFAPPKESIQRKGGPDAAYFLCCNENPPWFSPSGSAYWLFKFAPGKFVASDRGCRKGLPAPSAMCGIHAAPLTGYSYQKLRYSARHTGQNQLWKFITCRLGCTLFATQHESCTIRKISCNTAVFTILGLATFLPWLHIGVTLGLPSLKRWNNYARPFGKKRPAVLLQSVRL
ncbi:hypothetical protein EDE11_103232 [Methylomonas methanica]|uniref:Uncharacterized protein n=1 Tax=Methylomonas methanica TaxID=421 RepID=A0ABY2CUF4_METMH|nr:hypothetical protein EDE11_103232 [Methylomonas methanica]